MFDDLVLYEYPLLDGEVFVTAKEYVQMEIWSSSPMIWLGLIVYDKNCVVMKDFRWPETAYAAL